MTELDLALSIALGVGLAAAVGFRVFLPLLVVSIAAYTGDDYGRSFTGAAFSLPHAPRPCSSVWIEQQPSKL